MQKRSSSVFFLTFAGSLVGMAVDSLPFGGVAAFAESVERVDFGQELIPVFTKAGCNSGACHGAALGRGGFKLSLFGGSPRADYRAIVAELEGRRVDLARPAQSLLLLKSTGQIRHRGGRRFRAGDEGALRVERWIREGALYVESGRRFRSLEVRPSRHIAETPGASVMLSAEAHFSDGSRVDVTPWTVFAVDDASAVVVDAAGLARVRRRGRHVVTARYLHAVESVELLVPLTDAEVDLSSHPRRNFVDDEVLAVLETLGLRPSAPADDATFLRRATLDLTGRLPTVDALNGFLNDTDPDRRSRLVDRLLASREFTDYWSYRLAKLLRVRPRPREAEGAKTYHSWVTAQIEAGVGWDVVVRALLLAEGDTRENGPANFYRMVDGPREQAELLSEVFMGTRLRCANCHNHPLDHWTQDDYHGLAAVFARIEFGPVVRFRPNGGVMHPGTLEQAVPRIPGERFLTREADGRAAVASWLTSRGNPYFAPAIVNRLWKHMLGRGLVEPVDDFRATNPATHPMLLTRLAHDFEENGYDLRRTLRWIATSTTYGRSARATAASRVDDRFYSHAVAKPLEPEVLADAISDVLGIADAYGDLPPGTRAVSLVDPGTPSRALDVLGRCGRRESCEATERRAGGLPEKLHFLNGELINARIRVPGSRLERLLQEGRASLEIVEEFYRVALSRGPAPDEREFWRQHLAELETSDARKEFLEDFVWGILSCNEFTRSR